MTRLASFTVAIVMASGGFGLGFWFGFDRGGRVALSSEFIPRAAISLHQINAIRAGKLGNVVVALEGDIDNALLWAHDLDQDPLKSLYQPLWGIPLDYNSQYLTRLANYRKVNLSPMRADALVRDHSGHPSEVRTFHDSMMRSIRENDAIIASMVQRYSTPANP